MLKLLESLKDIKIVVIWLALEVCRIPLKQILKPSWSNFFLLLDRLMKNCTKCHTDKPLSEFTKDKQKNDGLRPSCKACERIGNQKYYQNNRKILLEKNSEYQKQKPYVNQAAVKRYDKTEKGKSRLRRAALKFKFGITESQYDDLFKSQNGVCKICGSPPTTTRLHVDHCHKTNSIRGLLCLGCNTGIGMLKDNVTVLENAIKYLEDTKSWVIVG